MALAIVKVTWLLDLFTKLGVFIQMSITVMSDTKSAIQLATNPIFHK